MSERPVALVTVEPQVGHHLQELPFLLLLPSKAGRGTRE
jgi:hypothetical protein